ncbi:MAG: hypothetical protein PHH54_06700 [Candidatus Nanoarchaeia archaeon]|nr:hypothetical protein [Candidatus Nanoarchaeia archaeon]MDD5741644.1 hypothetical protein [Candidatus Nanoarchaeia archaeon]
MDVYSSKNSKYYFEGDSLIKEGKGKKKNLGNKVVYISDNTIEALLKKYAIKIKETQDVSIELGDKLMTDSDIIGMDRTKIGGRFFGLVKNNGYTIYYTGKITSIEKEEEYKIQA